MKKTEGFLMMLMPSSIAYMYGSKICILGSARLNVWFTLS